MTPRTALGTPHTNMSKHSYTRTHTPHMHTYHEKIKVNENLFDYVKIFIIILDSFLHTSLPVFNVLSLLH